MMNRRSFARVLTLTAAGSAVASPLHAAHSRRSAVRTIKPRRLSEGDTVGMVLPASATFERDRIKLGQEQLEALGLKVELGKHVYDRHGYLAGTDEDRAADINRMFADERIDGIVAYTGGWGSPRLLPLLDYDVIRRNPKVFVGFSDITALLVAIQQKTGLITFHGPVAASTFEKYSVENFRKVVMEAQPAGVLAPPPKRADVLVERVNRITRIAGGKASGQLTGGNLTLVAATMGTPYEIETEGKILFLEDRGEELYRIDRMLTQLHLGGKLSRLAGFVFGRCTDCTFKGPGFSLEDLLFERFEQLGIPAISGLSFGHIEQKLTLPLGVRATLDGDAGTLSLDEAAVS